MKYLFNYSQYITEQKYSGGIKQDQIQTIIGQIKESLFPLLRIDEKDIAFIGSAGKKKLEDVSYNINIALSKQSLDESNNLEKEKTISFLESQIKRLKYNYGINEKNNHLIVEWPINEDDIVEVHLQVSENLEWLKFTRHSPNVNEEESEFTGKYRESLLSAICETVHREIISYLDKNGTVKEYHKYKLDIDEGLSMVTKSFEGKNGVLKNAAIIENSERSITSNPSKFVKLIFGESFEPEDVMTFEQCMSALNDTKFAYPKKRKKIKERLKHNLVKAKLVIPENLM